MSFFLCFGDKLTYSIACTDCFIAAAKNESQLTEVSERLLHAPRSNGVRDHGVAKEMHMSLYIFS